MKEITYYILEIVIEHAMRLRMKWKDFICKNLSNDSVLCLIVNLSFLWCFFCVKNYGPQNSNKQNLNKSYIRVLCKIYQSYWKTLYIFPDNMIYMWVFINIPDVFAKYVYNMQNNLFCVEYFCCSLQYNVK